MRQLGNSNNLLRGVFFFTLTDFHSRGRKCCELIFYERFQAPFFESHDILKKMEITAFKE